MCVLQTKQPCSVVSSKMTKLRLQSQIIYLYYALYILMRHNLSESAKVVSFPGSDLLLVYWKGLSVEETRATEGLRGCNLSVLGVSVRPILMLHKCAILVWKNVHVCLFVCSCACVLLKVFLHPVRCYDGVQVSLYLSFISPFLTRASPLFTPSLLLLESVSTYVIQ